MRFQANKNFHNPVLTKLKFNLDSRVHNIRQDGEPIFFFLDLDLDDNPKSGKSYHNISNFSTVPVYREVIIFILLYYASSIYLSKHCSSP